MEISLATKRKLAFVQGIWPRPSDDPVKAEQWDTCNNLIIAWIMNCVSDSIARSILYIQSAREIWLQLEKRFCLSNGSHKYRLNREVYAIRQNDCPVSEYYTKIKSVWGELDNMADLPHFTVVNDEIAAFLRALARQQEEQKLFQFLNGLDEGYSSQRSQILLMTPLPDVESACALLQQEKMQ